MPAFHVVRGARLPVFFAWWAHTPYFPWDEAITVIVSFMRRRSRSKVWRIEGFFCFRHAAIGNGPSTGETFLNPLLRMQWVRDSDLISANLEFFKNVEGTHAHACFTMHACVAMSLCMRMLTAQLARSHTISGCLFFSILEEISRRKSIDGLGPTNAKIDRQR